MPSPTTTHGTPPLTKQRLWVDTDIALGAERGDVDDGFALAAVAAAVRQSPDSLELLGVSAVRGNTDAASAQRAAEALLARLPWVSRDLPVVAQAEAPAALAALPAGASLLALGPLTNLARAVELDAELPARLTVRAVGTVLDRRRHPLMPFFCLNFRHDPAAGRAFFRLPFQRRLTFPLDVVQRLRFGSRALRAVAASGSLGTYLAAESQRWLRWAPLRYLSRSFPVWDLVAALEAVGHLPGATYNATGDTLTGFDARSALPTFLDLIAEPGGPMTND